MMSTMGFKSIYKQQMNPHPETDSNVKEVLTYNTMGLKLPKQEVRGAKIYPVWGSRGH